MRAVLKIFYLEHLFEKLYKFISCGIQHLQGSQEVIKNCWKWLFGGIVNPLKITEWCQNIVKKST